MVVIARCPYRPGDACRHTAGAVALDPLHQTWEVMTLAQLDQTMPMIGHQYPGQQSSPPPHALVDEGPGDCHCVFLFGKQAAAMRRGEGHQVNLVRLRKSAPTEGGVAWAGMCGHACMMAPGAAAAGEVLASSEGRESPRSCSDRDLRRSYAGETLRCRSDVSRDRGFKA